MRRVARVSRACQARCVSLSRRSAWAIAPLVVVAVLAITHAASGASNRQFGHPPGLTKAGVLLWDFEALLRDTFGSREVCTITGGGTGNAPPPDYGDFVAPHGGCSPEDVYSSYVYVFASARNSPFRLVSRSFKGGAFGNYPVPVRVAKLYVAYDRAAKTFLISYGDAATFTLDCIAPNP